MYSVWKHYLVAYHDYIKNANCIQDMMPTLFMSATELKKWGIETVGKLYAEGRMFL